MISTRTGLLYCLLLLAFTTSAQTYVDSIQSFRNQYRQDFLTDNHSPLKEDDTSYLRFYAPDKEYCVVARFTATPNAKPFEIMTHSGKTKPYRQYGVFSFKIDDKNLELAVYQGLNLIKIDSLKDDLFIPFTDLTNYETTFGGGRYIDLKIGDIKNGRVVLDFNKCYNPYCAFAGGYSCPIPPEANKLSIAIKAGEQLFGKAVKE